MGYFENVQWKFCIKESISENLFDKWQYIKSSDPRLLTMSCAWKIFHPSAFCKVISLKVTNFEMETVYGSMFDLPPQGKF